MDETIKQCTKCGQFKPLTEFGKASKAKDGLFWSCKECSREAGRAKLARHAAEHVVQPPQLDGTKLCPVCGEEKLKNEFCIAKTTKDGLHFCCRVCDKVRCKETAAKNRMKNSQNPPSMEGTKLCKQCGEVKQKTEFYITKTTKDGLCHRCKTCKHENDIKQKTRNAKNRALNPPSTDSLKKCTYCGVEKPLNEFFNCDSNKDGKHFRCKSCSAQLDKEYRDEFPERRWALSTISAHRIRGFEVVITSKELAAMAESTKRCPICGCVLDWGRKENKHLLPNSPTLDRKNNDKKITVESTWILCHRCNSAKHNFTIPELIEWCDNVKRWWADQETNQLPKKGMIFNQEKLFD
jgi:hypothetical protein